MVRTIFCVKQQCELEGLTTPPYPGPLGQRIYETISQQAWQAWLTHQTMLINENRLSAIDPKARQLLATEMVQFLFGEGGTKPDGYVPLKVKK